MGTESQWRDEVSLVIVEKRVEFRSDTAAPTRRW